MLLTVTSNRVVPRIAQSNNVKKSESTYEISKIEPTYKNDISSIKSGEVKSTVIKNGDWNAINTLEKEVGKFFDLHTDTDIHVYDASEVAEELNVPFRNGKIVGYHSFNGVYTVKCYFDDAGSCKIDVLTDESEQGLKFPVTEDGIVDMSVKKSKGLSQPLDSSTFKNTILKTVKMGQAAMERINGYSNNKYNHFQESIVYDPLTKTANLEELADRLEDQLQSGYQFKDHDYEALTMEEESYLDAMLMEMDEKFTSILDEMF